MTHNIEAVNNMSEIIKSKTQSKNRNKTSVSIHTQPSTLTDLYKLGAEIIESDDDPMEPVQPVDKKQG